MTSTLKSQLHQKGLSRADQALLILASFEGRPTTVAAVRAAAVRDGVRGAKGWNISATLANLTGKAIRTGDGWELTDAGRVSVAALIGAPVIAIASPLRSALGNLTSPDVKAFVAEAVACIEGGHYRAAVVLSWVGALGVLYEHVVTSHLAGFNTEAARRDAKWRPAKTVDDLARMKEFEFLQVLESISVVGKSVKTELEACLKLRNGCGHPNSLRVAESRVAAHVETLTLNVFAKFV